MGRREIGTTVGYVGPTYRATARLPRDRLAPECRIAVSPAAPIAEGSGLIKSARVIVDRDFTISAINRRVFGSFVEHMGRCVYGGIYEPGDRSADARGFRRDVLDLVKELGVTMVRYPGGNFLSGYDWRDGIGPTSHRPHRLDLAWHSLETNEFGLDEFMAWCAAADVEPMLATNLGTAGLKEALQLLEYANLPTGSAWADQRAANAATEPYGVKLWCLGNEMDGAWQLGHLNAEEYANVAARVARGMRQLDPGVELVACGSSSRDMATFGRWEETVLEQTYDLVEYVSAHAYYENTGDLQEFLLSATGMDAFISEVCAVADAVKARTRSQRTMLISFDEWNVWYQSAMPSRLDTTSWDTAARLSEDDYTVADAVVVGNLLISLLRRSDRVKAACLAQLVNTIASIRAEPGEKAWRQTTFFPFSLTARHARGDSLLTRVISPQLTSDKYGIVDVLDAIATIDQDGGEAAVFLVNRAAGDPLTTTVDLRGFGAFEAIEHVVLSDADPLRANSSQNPSSVGPVSSIAIKTTDTAVEVLLPAVSWSMLRLRLK